MMTNVILLALMSFIEALQVLIIVALIGSFIPIPISSFAEHLYSLSLYDVRPEREMFFYRLWVLMAIALQAVFVFCFRAELSSNTLRKKLYPFAAVSGFWVLLQVFAAFKVFLWGNPPWARGLLYMGIAGGMASTIFWPELQRFGKNVFERFQQDTRLQRSPLWDLGFLIGLMVLLVPGNLGNVLGRMFVRDQFYHLDSILMAPGWAHLNGLGLNTDITSEYSVALPIILSEILKHSIGFDYPSAVVLIMAIVFMYYIALYFFARQWLMSRALAIFAVLLTVKLQMFHWGVAPLVWQFPSATALRHWPDIVFFVCVWRHIQTSKQQWLWAAATAVGFSLAWMMDVGMYMLCALLVYTVAWAYQQRRGTGYLLKILAIMFAAPCATAFFLWTLLQPQAVFQAAYWRNAFEFAGLFVQGWGPCP